MGGVVPCRSEQKMATPVGLHWTKRFNVLLHVLVLTGFTRCCKTVRFLNWKKLEVVWK